LAGHERYLKTTVFGMTGHAPDFGKILLSKTFEQRKMFFNHMYLQNININTHCKFYCKYYFRYANDWSKRWHRRDDQGTSGSCLGIVRTSLRRRNKN